MNGLPLKPQVATLPDGRIAVFVAGAYQYLPREAAQALRDNLSAELAKPAPAAVDRAG